VAFIGRSDKHICECFLQNEPNPIKVLV